MWKMDALKKHLYGWLVTPVVLEKQRPRDVAKSCDFGLFEGLVLFLDETHVSTGPAVESRAREGASEFGGWALQWQKTGQIDQICSASRNGGRGEPDDEANPATSTELPPELFSTILAIMKANGGLVHPSISDFTSPQAIIHSTPNMPCPSILACKEMKNNVPRPKSSLRKVYTQFDLGQNDLGHCFSFQTLDQFLPSIPAILQGILKMNSGFETAINWQLWGGWPSLEPMNRRRKACGQTKVLNGTTVPQQEGVRTTAVHDINWDGIH
nr:hypothetical protein Iba_chr07dCG9560 [Ipomoea batatas]